MREIRTDRLLLRPFREKELSEYGFCVGKISLKEETVMFRRI